MQRLDGLLELAKNSLEIKRKTIEKQTENGMYPYSAHYLKEVKARTGSYWFNHFNTIGLVGMNEACRNFLGCEITTPAGQQFALRVLGHMREVILSLIHISGLSSLPCGAAEGSHALGHRAGMRFGSHTAHHLGVFPPGQP